MITLGKNNLKNVPCFADTMYIFALYFFLNPVSRVCWKRTEICGTNTIHHYQSLVLLAKKLKNL